MATRVFGLTGGIGSGKTAVADAFRALGIEVVDADEVAHALSAPGNDGHRAVIGAFGNWVVADDGRLDRARIRERAFADPAFRTALEDVLHPLIAAHIDASIARWSGPYGIIVAPLLFERGNLVDRVERVLVVDAPEAQQIERTMRRSGLSRDAVRAIMSTQLTRAERLARADDVIDNSGALADIKDAVALIDAQWRAIAQDQDNAAGGCGTMSVSNARHR